MLEQVWACAFWSDGQQIADVVVSVSFPSLFDKEQIWALFFRLHGCVCWRTGKTEEFRERPKRQDQTGALLSIQTGTVWWTESKSKLIKRFCTIHKCSLAMPVSPRACMPCAHAPVVCAREETGTARPCHRPSKPDYYRRALRKCGWGSIVREFERVWESFPCLWKWCQKMTYSVAEQKWWNAVCLKYWVGHNLTFHLVAICWCSSSWPPNMMRRWK